MIGKIKLSVEGEILAKKIYRSNPPNAEPFL
jgi:hypothetical protein